MAATTQKTTTPRICFDPTTFLEKGLASQDPHFVL
jgi:hypothetical protein